LSRAVQHALFAMFCNLPSLHRWQNLQTMFGLQALRGLARQSGQTGSLTNLVLRCMATGAAAKAASPPPPSKGSSGSGSGKSPESQLVGLQLQSGTLGISGSPQVLAFADDAHPACTLCNHSQLHLSSFRVPLPASLP
jgi:hypothetical protein